MARPTKRGLDYFPVDTDMDEDDKLYAIEAAHRDGFKIIVKLLMAIYREGYFKQWSEQAALAFAGRKGLAIDDVLAVVKTAIEVGFFCRELFESCGVLTSAGIQRRYVGGAQARERIQICTRYALVSPEEFVASVRKKIVISEETPVSGQKTPVNWQTILVSRQKTQPGVSGEKTPVFGEVMPQREGGNKGREEREGQGGRETNASAPPPAASAVSGPAGQPADAREGEDASQQPDAPAAPIDEPPDSIFELDKLPPALRRAVARERTKDAGDTRRKTEQAAKANADYHAVKPPANGKPAPVPYAARGAPPERDAVGQEPDYGEPTGDDVFPEVNA